VKFWDSISYRADRAQWGNFIFFRHPISTWQPLSHSYALKIPLQPVARYSLSVRVLPWRLRPPHLPTGYRLDCQRPTESSPRGASFLCATSAPALCLSPLLSLLLRRTVNKVVAYGWWRFRAAWLKAKSFALSWSTFCHTGNIGILGTSGIVYAPLWKAGQFGNIQYNTE